MKINFQLVCVAVTAAVWGGGVLCAHDNVYVHTWITHDAYKKFLDLRQGEESPRSLLSSDWGIDLAPSKTYAWGATAKGISSWTGTSPTEDETVGWFVQGVYDEDALLRVVNHFYDPFNGAPLTDYIGAVPDWMGQNSDAYTWMSTGVGYTGNNLETWWKARHYAWEALTSDTADNRDEKVARLFYTLGKVVHLLQDTSQPDHVRNDNHFLPWHRWIENYGAHAMQNLGAPVHAILKERLEAAAPLDWRNAGFRRLKDFWDRDLYTNTSGPLPLDRDAAGETILGLAEFANGNFLGEDATYYDERPFNKTYPYPRFSSTTYASATADPFPALLAKLKPMRALDGDNIGNGLFLEKVRDGIHVGYHAVIPYSAYMMSLEMPEIIYLPKNASVEDVNVGREYHEILLPKTVSYTGGLLDYFFRGRIKVESTWDYHDLEYHLKITNLSGQTLKGGQFFLYSENSQKIRSAVSLDMTWSGASTLADQAEINADYKPNETYCENFILIYKGSIGVASDATYGTVGSPDALMDPEDENMALAACRFEMAPRFTGIIALRGQNSTVAKAQGYPPFTLSWKRFLNISTSTTSPISRDTSYLNWFGCEPPTPGSSYGWDYWSEKTVTGSAHYGPPSSPEADPLKWIEYTTPVVNHPGPEPYQTGGDYVLTVAGDSDYPGTDETHYVERYEGSPLSNPDLAALALTSEDCSSGTNLFRYEPVHAVVGWSVDKKSNELKLVARQPRYSYSDDFDCLEPIFDQYGAENTTTLTVPDSEANIRARLALAGPRAYEGKSSFEDFGADLAYPNLRYYGFKELHSKDTANGCGLRGQGETGFDGNQWDVAMGYGLAMYGDPYFEGKYTTFEQLVASSLQQETAIMDFKGALSVCLSDLPPGASANISYELVTRKLFGQLHRLSVCSPADGGTETSEERTLTLSEPVSVPVDHYGSTAFNDPSWNSVPAQLMMPTEGSDGFLATAYCHRNKFRFYSKVGQALSVTLRKTVLNYKDAWDTPSTPGGDPLNEPASPPVVTDITVSLNADFHGVFADIERGENITNHRQEIWYKPIAVTSLATGATLDPSVVGVWRKLRRGNMGIPQLDHMAEIAWKKGKGGLRKHTQFYKKMVFAYDKVIFSTGTCLPVCANNLADDDAVRMDFSTFVKFERLLDPEINSSSWTDLKCFDLEWHCVEAESSQGSVTLDVPTVSHMPRPPVWGSLAYETIGATQAWITTESHDSEVYLAYLSKSGVPTRAFYGVEQELQDGEADLFVNLAALKALENAGTIESLYDYYEGFDCGCSTRLTCESLFPRKEYDPYDYPFSIYTADPYFGINNVSDVDHVNVPLDQAPLGYYGTIKELRSTALFSVEAPANHYVTIRNLKVTLENP